MNKSYNQATISNKGLPNRKDDDYSSRMRDESTAAMDRFMRPKTLRSKIPVITDPMNLKGEFIPLLIQNPTGERLLVQGQEGADKSRHENDADFEHSELSNVWYIDVNRLQDVIVKYTDYVLQHRDNPPERVSTKEPITSPVQPPEEVTSQPDSPPASQPKVTG